MTQRALVAYGDSTSIATWSNIPYFFLHAGMRARLFEGGVVVRPERFRTRRLLWNASRPLRLHSPRGFMYSRSYLDDLWAARREPLETDEYVSHYQLLPPPETTGEPVTYYIDATMRQFFEEYGHPIGPRIRREALARERFAYDAARFVVCMSHWCADDVMSTYDVPREKVRVITPGANLDEAAVPEANSWDPTFSPLRLGIVGLGWQRKGGPALLRLATALQRIGISVEVVVVGPKPSTLPTHPCLRALGFIDKARDLPRFIELVRSFHFGCLLSRAEALGIFPLECLRLGVPIIVSNAGGLVDPHSAGFRVPLDGDSESLAEEIAALIAAPERYSAMRAAAEGAGLYYSWDRTASEFVALLDS